MIEWLAWSAAVRLNQFTGNKNIDIDYVRYQLARIFSVTLIWLFSFILGFIFQNIIEVFIALVVILVFRKVTGGMHFQLDFCTILTTAIVFVSVNFHLGPLILLQILSIILVIVFGGKKKSIGLAMIVVNFWIGSDLIANCFLIQSISLIPKLGGEQSA